VIAGLAQREGENLPQLLLVVDQENRFHPLLTIQHFPHFASKS
jgi:hypothetical protein